MPYLPPPPENLEPEFICALVIIPNADEYRAAFLGQFAELSDVWNWEADKATQAVIRQVWLDAELETLECWNMAVCDDIIALLEEIRDKDVCCEAITEAPGQDEIIGVDEDDIVTSDTDIGGGVIPPEFEDVPAFESYLCGAAVQIADGLPGLVDRTAQSIILASNALAIITLIVLAFGNIIGMGIAATLAAGLGIVTLLDLLDVTDWVFDLRERILGGEDLSAQAQTKSELEGIRDEIRDAVACSNDANEAAAAVHALLDANITDTLYRSVLKLATGRGIMALVFNGLVNAPDSNECSCLDTLYASESQSSPAPKMFVWDGAQYVRHTLGNPLEITLPVTLRVKGSGDAGSFGWTQVAFTNLAGSHALENREERSVSISVNGANGSVHTYSLTDKDGNVIESATGVADNGPNFPVEASGVYRILFTGQAGLRVDANPTYWLDITIS